MIYAAPAAHLTVREREVCAMVAFGEMRARIAARLGIGTETVETHMEKAAQRLCAAFPSLGPGTPRQIILRYSATTGAFSKSPPFGISERSI